MTLLDFVLLLLATARLTRFITTDVLFETPRNALITRLISGPVESPTAGIRGKVAYLIVCDWCASVYVGAALMGAWHYWGETMWFMMTTAALSMSYGAGYLASADRAGD